MEKTTCVICLDEIDKDVKYLRCFHSFHTDCINKWEKESPQCPVCKTPMYDQPEQKRIESPEISLGIFAAGAGLALIAGMVQQPQHEIKYNPYMQFVEVLTREFSRNVISRSFNTVNRQVQHTIEEKVVPRNRILEKALILKDRLQQSNVDLSDIDLTTLAPDSSREVIGFTYIKLLEKRDACRDFVTPPNAENRAI